VASFGDSSVTLLQRDTSTGKLTHDTMYEDGGSEGINGLSNAKSVAVSSDGINVYAVGQNDDALVIFKRDASTGLLTFVSTELFVDDMDSVDGLEAPQSVMVTPDGSAVYVGSKGSTDQTEPVSISVFERIIQIDTDLDGIIDSADNCPNDANAGQEDDDSDNIGDVCDDFLNDRDNDGAEDDVDAFPDDPSESLDTDGDLIGNNTDTDDDGDGVLDDDDDFPLDDSETTDSDDDGVGDNSDNCVDVANADQADSDSNGTGDACEVEEDDGFITILSIIKKAMDDQEADQ